MHGVEKQHFKKVLMSEGSFHSLKEYFVEDKVLYRGALLDLRASEIIIHLNYHRMKTLEAVI